MNIQILDSALRRHIKTTATPKEISRLLSLSSVSVERLEKIGDDYLYDIEVTTNRVDLMSVIGIARELSAVLQQNGFNGEFKDVNSKITASDKNELLNIQIDKSLVNRVTAAILDVNVSDSPEFVKKSLENSGIRTLNNLIDITNFIMREVGHPAHVFDYDKLGKKITIRESIKGETITTLDGKTHILKGGDIVADDENGRIIDLLGIMGLENSVVTDNTKRIVLFFDNNNPKKIRKTSMGLGIRTEAAVLNEKDVDPELIAPTLILGIELYEKYAEGKLVGNIIDIYPNKVAAKTISVRKKRISSLIGVYISDKTVKEILTKLSFKVTEEKDTFKVTPPSFRASDVTIEEDVIEEVARIYGYDKIPNSIPPIDHKRPKNIENSTFYWENRIKNAMKYWGFNEVYTYSMVSEELYEGPTDSAVKISNPLSQDHVYMRATLVPSLLEVIQNNYEEEISIFEIANVYIKQTSTLPHEKLHLAGVIKKGGKDTFFHAKGILESLFDDLGATDYDFRKRQEGGAGADVFIKNKQIGNIELLEENIVNFEIEFLDLIKSATNKKVFKKLNEYPPIIEDIRIEVKKDTPYKKIIEIILSVNPVIENATLLDEYEDKKTFRITYRDKNKSLSNEEVTPIREKLIETLKTKIHAKIG